MHTPIKSWIVGLGPSQQVARCCFPHTTTMLAWTQLPCAWDHRLLSQGRCLQKSCGAQELAARGCGGGVKPLPGTKGPPSSLPRQLLVEPSVT